MTSIIILAAKGSSTNLDIPQTVSPNNFQIRFAVIRFQKAKYKRISFNEIPEPIENSLSKEFSAYKASKAFKGDDGTFKIAVSFDNRKGTFVFNKKGEILKVEASGYEKEQLNNNI